MRSIDYVRRIVRVPLNRAGTLHRIGKRASSLLQELGRQPTNLEISEGMDISEDEVAKTMMISQVHLSLDAPMTPGEDNRLLDYLPDNMNPTPDEITFEKALSEAIEESLSSLKERESKILRLYFGLDGADPMTLEDIGTLLQKLLEGLLSVAGFRNDFHIGLHPDDADDPFPHQSVVVDAEDANARLIHR